VTSDPELIAESVALTKADYLRQAQSKIYDLQYYEGGSLRLAAFQMKDIMDGLIALTDG
jgi:hypothetical protein